MKKAKITKRPKKVLPKNKYVPLALEPIWPIPKPEDVSPPPVFLTGGASSLATPTTPPSTGKGLTMLAGLIPLVISWIPIIGGVGGSLLAVASLLTQLSTGQWDGATMAADWGAITTAFAVIFAKAKNVTGGTVAATPEAVARVA